MRFTRFERRQFVQTRAVRWVPRSSIRTACRFGSQRRLVLFIAWLTLLPAIGPLPQTSHLLAITGELYHARRSSTTLDSINKASRRRQPELLEGPGPSYLGRKGTVVQNETKRARIAIDAMGGDNAPAEIVAGAILAHRDGGVDLALVGDEARIRPLLGDLAGAIEVVHVAGEISMDAPAA